MPSYTMVITRDMWHKVANAENTKSFKRVIRLKAYKVNNLNVKKTNLKPDLVYLLLNKNGPRIV